MAQTASLAGLYIIVITDVLPQHVGVLRQLLRQNTLRHALGLPHQNRRKQKPNHAGRA